MRRSPVASICARSKSGGSRKRRACRSTSRPAKRTSSSLTAKIAKDANRPVSLTLDGTDPEAIAGAFGWAAERARAGLGPTLIELVAMRLCGHAHHDVARPRVTGAPAADAPADRVQARPVAPHERLATDRHALVPVDVGRGRRHVR